LSNSGGFCEGACFCVFWFALIGEKVLPTQIGLPKIDLRSEA
jgi:hypothetical protein